MAQNLRIMARERTLADAKGALRTFRNAGLKRCKIEKERSLATRAYTGIYEVWCERRKRKR